MARITHTWQQPLNGQPDSYHLCEGSASGNEVLLLTIPGNVTTYTHNHADGVLYAYVTAVYGSTESGPSNETRTVIDTPNNPSSPYNSVIQGQTATFVCNNFDHPSNILAGHVRWDITQAGLVIATSEVPNGWSVAVNSNGIDFDVHAPLFAIPEGGYEMRYDDGM